MRLTNLSRALAFIAMGAAASCGDSTASETGKINVQMTDAPFPFSEVSRVDMFVVRIDAKVEETDSASIAKEDDMKGWVTIATPNTLINLLDLREGKTVNLGTTALATGSYKSFRLILDTDQSSVTLVGGAKPDIKWPSAKKTGVKIKLDVAINVTKDSSMMLLDFDVGRSFVLRGATIGGNGLLFKPVIRAAVKELTGSVTGSVRADSPTGAVMAGTTVEILTAGTTLSDTTSAKVVRTAFTDASGNYKIMFLLPGTYVVRATPPASSTYVAALLSGGLTITSGVTTSAGVLVVTK